MRKVIVGLLFFVSTLSLVYSQSVLDNKDLLRFKGFFDSYYDSDKDKIYLEVKQLDSSFLYVSSLSQGLGNNDLFLDRGQLGGTRIVHFHKAGNKLLLIQPNLQYRAITANDLERKSVEEAFAKSVLFGFPIIEKITEGYLIDLTPFLLQDAHGVSDILKEKKQGQYQVDLSRSALNMERTKSFPKNVDFDVLITLKGQPEGGLIKSVTPDAKYVTVFQHHSFVELPDDQFKPRVYHPNCGAISTAFKNYSAPIDRSMEVRYVWRHRLEKKNPKAKVSEAVEPIIYYLDNGTPEPVRTALLEGAQWWNAAFESIGYKDAFQVKILPADADPLDVRYNVIQWVHRSTRGWSYGGGVVDPRTGEIIKGHVSLGSLRVRQDFAIAKALSKAPYSGDHPDTQELLDFALARIRQLSAHEVGHTLGFTHNFAASTNDRASVMDYPHPLVRLQDGKIDLSQAYAVGIGEWDKITVAYSYGDYDNEKEDLQKHLNNAMNNGFKFMSDQDSRPLGASHAYSHLWDNGTDVIEELNKVIQIREKAIEQFGRDHISSEETYEDLEDLFVLLYFYHRYQVEAAVKYIGGQDYAFGLKNELEYPSKPISRADQLRALESVLKTIDPEFLKIPKEKLALFPARSASKRGRESFEVKTSPAFDPLSAATTAADFVLSGLLHPHRLNRLVTQQLSDPTQLTLDEVLQKTSEAILYRSSTNAELELYHQSVKEVYITKLMHTAQNMDILPQAKSTIEAVFEEFSKSIKLDSPFDKHLGRLIAGYFSYPQVLPQVKYPKIPDGSPIGMEACGH